MDPVQCLLLTLSTSVLTHYVIKHLRFFRKLSFFPSSRQICQTYFQKFCFLVFLKLLQPFTGEYLRIYQLLTFSLISSSNSASGVLLVSFLPLQLTPGHPLSAASVKPLLLLLSLTNLSLNYLSTVSIPLTVVFPPVSFRVDQSLLW